MQAYTKEIIERLMAMDCFTDDTIDENTGRRIVGYSNSLISWATLEKYAKVEVIRQTHKEFDSIDKFLESLIGEATYFYDVWREGEKVCVQYGVVYKVVGWKE